MFLGFSGLDVEKITFYKVPFGANNRYQFANVPANSTIPVYVFGNWGTDFRAFINQIGIGPSSLPWDKVRFIWLIDGETVEVFNYQVGRIPRPKHFADPYIAKTTIEWRVRNEDTIDHICEVLCNGMLVMKPEAKARYNV